MTIMSQTDLLPAFDVGARRLVLMGTPEMFANFRAARTTLLLALLTTAASSTAVTATTATGASPTASIITMPTILGGLLVSLIQAAKFCRCRSCLAQNERVCFISVPMLFRELQKDGRAPCKRL